MSKILCLMSVILFVCVADAAPKRPDGWIVSQSAKGQLEAHSANGKNRKFLRSGFYGAWDISPDGKRLVWNQTPSDVKFFSARASRYYLFEQHFDEKQARPLIVAYGKDQTKAFLLSDQDIWGANYDFQSENLIVTHAEWDFYRTQKRTALFNASNQSFNELVDTKSLDLKIRNRMQSQAVIDRAKSKIVYIGASPINSGTDAYFSEKDWNSYLIAYELSSKKSRILVTSPFGLDRPRISPDGKSCLFVNYSRRDEKNLAQGRIFQADLTTGVLKQLTRPQNETDDWPDWSPDGRFIVWQRENWNEKNLKKRFKLCVMKADGSVQKPLRFGDGFNGLRWIADLPDWSRFAKFPIEAKVFPNKTK